MKDWLPDFDDTEVWGGRKDCTDCHNPDTGSAYLPKNLRNPHNRVQIKCLQCHQPHPSHIPIEKGLFEVVDKVSRKTDQVALPLTLQRSGDQDQKCSACHMEQYHRLYGERAQEASATSSSNLGADRHVQTAESDVGDRNQSVLSPLKINKVTPKARATFVKGRLCIGCHYAEHSFQVESPAAWDQKCLECHSTEIPHVRDTGWGCIKCHMSNDWQKKPLGHSL